jgi:hypothetical protein
MKSPSADPFTPAFVPAAPAWNGIMTSPSFERHGSEFTMTWTEPPVVMTLSRVREGRDGVHAELAIVHAGFEIHMSRLGLLSTSAREAVVKKLQADPSILPWRLMLERACIATVRAARQGEPLVTLTGRPTSRTRELLPRLLYEGEPTQIYGDGDTGKSLVALAIAAAVHSGTALPFGLKPARAVPVAFLDWETTRDTLDGRLAEVAAGLGIDPPGILYKPMTRPLIDEADDLAAEFARRRIGLVVVDSKMFAVAGGDGGAFHEPITAFYGALRLFAPAASLVLNHITGEAARHGGAARPFGGAFAFNGPRLIWEAKRDHDVTDATAIAFTCTKANNLPRKPEPFGLRFQPGNGTITVYPFDLTEASPAVVAGASTTYRIRLALASGLSTPEAIADHLSAKPDTVKRLLRRMRKDGKARERTGAPDTWELVS